uniref:Uncharacterized protein n=1 Tax=Oryza brachyantha TaxID=4533 RepID=J3ML90_ORYBR
MTKFTTRAARRQSAVGRMNRWRTRRRGVAQANGFETGQNIEMVSVAQCDDNRNMLPVLSSHHYFGSVLTMARNQTFQIGLIWSKGVPLVLLSFGRDFRDDLEANGSFGGVRILATKHENKLTGINPTETVKETIFNGFLIFFWI